MSKKLDFEIGDYVSDGGDEDGYVRAGKVTYIDYTNPDSPKIRLANAGDGAHFHNADKFHKIDKPEKEMKNEYDAKKQHWFYR